MGETKAKRMELARETYEATPIYPLPITIAIEMVRLLGQDKIENN